MLYLRGSPRVLIKSDQAHAWCLDYNGTALLLDHRLGHLTASSDHGSFRRWLARFLGSTTCSHTIGRLQFLDLLRRLQASQSSQLRTAQFAIRYKDLDEDLFSCILEELDTVMSSVALAEFHLDMGRLLSMQKSTSYTFWRRCVIQPKRPSA